MRPAEPGALSRRRRPAPGSGWHLPRGRSGPATCSPEGIYRHAEACVLHACTRAGYSFLVETTSSTSGSWMPTFVPLSLLEEEDSRDFCRDTPLPCSRPASSSLPVTS